MSPRSWLWVPGDQMRKIEHARTAGADAVILDLEDAVAHTNKDEGRRVVREALSDGGFGESEVWVRVNAPADGAGWKADLEAVAEAGPVGIVIPKVFLSEHVTVVVDELSQMDPTGSVAIAPIVTEQPAGVAAMAETLVASRDRTSVAMWGSEDLSAALGARRVKDDSGQMLDVFRVVRSLFLLAAGTAGVAAVDTPFLEIDDADGLGRESEDAAWQGFAGKQVIHPRHVAVVNRAFTPSDEEIRRATEVVEAFERADGGGTHRVQGAMVDPPHLLRAQGVIARAERVDGR